MPGSWEGEAPAEPNADSTARREPRPPVAVFELLVFAALTSFRDFPQPSLALRRIVESGKSDGRTHSNDPKRERTSRRYDIPSQPDRHLRNARYCMSPMTPRLIVNGTTSRNGGSTFGR